MGLGTPMVDGVETPRRAKSSSTLVRFAVNERQRGDQELMRRFLDSEAAIAEVEGIFTSAAITPIL